ncbi:MAG: helix-turn-helix domain-containing protein, partial [Chthoniobacterales bacterium]|nr:helix-turn-helix domain-containing protein [Chthoniobacterales bacterium]
MEPLGKKLQEARLRRKISLEEASRVTKIRASRIEEIEAEDFSGFSSLAYAKGFLLIYGKYLDVDVTPYLDAFETSREVSVDGYSYLQDGPSTAPL